MMYDAAVIGGGPAGAMAARWLAAGGLETVILERGVPPREKVCSGFLMDAWPLVREELGDVPPEVLCTERQLRGVRLHVPGAGTHFIDYPMPTAWRSVLDRWLVGCAAAAGAVVRWGNRFVGLEEGPAGYAVKVRSGEREEVVRARYVVGADGTASAVRAQLFPELKVNYSQGVQDIHAARVDLAGDEWHVFFAPEVAPFYFDVHRKDGLLVLECGCRLGTAKEVMGWGRKLLAEGYGFDAGQRPVKHRSCTEPGIYADLFSGRFQPARGNALLVGDAAGFILPVTGEGMWGAVTSARLAFEAIIHSRRKGVPAAGEYLLRLAGAVRPLEAAFERARAARKAAEQGGAALLSSAIRSWEDTLSRRG